MKQPQVIQRDKFLNDIRSCSGIHNVVSQQRSLAHQDSLGELLQEINEQISSIWDTSQDNDTSQQQDEDFNCFGARILVDSFLTKTNTTLTNTPKLEEITQIFQKSISLNSTPNKKPLMRLSPTNTSYDSYNQFSLGKTSETYSQGQMFMNDQKSEVINQSQNLEIRRKRRNYQNIEYFEIIPNNIIYDPRTTLMIKNIPNKYTIEYLLEEIDERFKSKYDFFYLPIDYNNGCNVGYAFVNFLDVRDIMSFFNMYDQRRWRKFNSEKICELRYARIQGRNALVSHFYYPQQLSKIQMLVDNQKIDGF